VKALLGSWLSVALFAATGCGPHSQETEAGHPEYVGSPTQLDAIPRQSATTADPAPEASDDQARAPFFLSSVDLRVSSDILAEFKRTPTTRIARERLRVTFATANLSPETSLRFPNLMPEPGGEEWIIPEFRDVPPKTKGPLPEASTFVVDYDEPDVQELLAGVPRGKRTPHGLEEFVSKAIANKTYARGFDIASRVAKFKSGDCTEHAVLLAALLRAVKIPARVAFGVVVALGPDSHFAAGHAWVEFAEKGRWQRLDAALYGAARSDAQLSSQQIGIPGLEESMRDFTWLYLTTDVMSDESAGFSRELAQRGLRSLVTKVTLTLAPR
jgi:transglutaminase-like putative cysteine protease